MPVTADKPAPYAPASAILDLIKRHRDRGLPGVVNSEVLARSGVSESLIPRTLQALVTLDLLDEGLHPTTTFDGIKLAPEVEYKKRMEDWLKAAYADVFSYVDPSSDDENGIRDAFRSYQPSGQRDRMVTLFQGLCAAAGLVPEKKAAHPSRPLRMLAKPSSSGSPKNKLTKFITPQTSRQHSSPAQNDLPPALAGLLASLPAAGEGWTAEDRAKFVATFGAVLDFCFPIIKIGSTQQNGDDQ